jgi:hypothetical protein
VSLVLSLIVTGATLTTFGAFTENRQDLETRNDSQDRARTAIDRMARELRNLASPTPSQPQAFDAAGAYELVFKTVDPNPPAVGSLNVANIKRVRYCLDASNRASARLVAQTQTWTSAEPPAVPSTTACPGSGWSATATLATAVTNRANNQERAVFRLDSTVLTDINSVHADLWTDVDTGGGAGETQISTGVFLRNQNRKPIAAFTATPSAQGIVLNGSASYDPEGEPLKYVWYDGTSKIGEGITYVYAVAAGTSHSLQLKVYDPATLEGISTVQAVIA